METVGRDGSRKNRSHLHFHMPFTCASSLLSESLQVRNRLCSAKIHKPLIMQKCPNLQRELKYQEFLHPEGKKANTSLRESILNSFKTPTTLHLYAWTHICAPPFSLFFPHGKKKPDVFILSLEKVWHSTTRSKDLYSCDHEECFAHKNF